MFWIWNYMCQSLINNQDSCDDLCKSYPISQWIELLAVLLTFGCLMKYWIWPVCVVPQSALLLLKALTIKKTNIERYGHFIEGNLPFVW